MPKHRRRPFRATRYDLLVKDGRRLTLDDPLTKDTEQLGSAIASIDPWRRTGVKAAAVASYLATRDDGGARFTLRLEGRLVGAVGVRFPWLRGPYLEFLALLPDCQGQGVGSAAIDWLLAETTGQAKNAWVCTATFNSRAVGFYESRGFEHVVEFQDIIAPGVGEVLMRKRLSN